MAGQPDITRLVEVIRQIPGSEAADFSEAVEKTLERELRDVPMSQRLKLIEEMVGRFKGEALHLPRLPCRACIPRSPQSSSPCSWERR